MHTVTMSPIRNDVQLVRPITILLLSTLLAASMGTILVSFLPYEVLLAKANSMSARGQLSFFSRSFYASLQWRVRIFGLFNAAIATVALGRRQSLIELLQTVRGDFRVLVHDLHDAWHAIPGLDLICVGGLSLFAGILRFPYLFQPMRGDEAYTFITYASHPFYVALSFYNDTNNHLFNTLLVRLSYLVFGDHTWALRLPVFVAGILLVPATYAASRYLYRTDSGTLAAGLIAASSPLIEYSTNARGYSLLCLEFMLLIQLSHYAFRTRNSAAWSLAIALSAIGFYTMPTMLYPFGGIVVWLLLLALSGERASQWKSIQSMVAFSILSAIVTVEFYAPVFAVSGPAAVFGKKLAIPKSFSAFLAGLPPSFVAVWNQWNRDIPLWVALALAIGFLLSLVFHKRLGRQVISVGLALPLSVGLVLAVQRIVPFPRVWIFALPLYLLAASAGSNLAIGTILERIRAPRTLALVVLAVPLFLGYRVTHTESLYAVNEGRGMGEISHFLKGQLQAGDSILAVVPSDTLLLYHFRHYGISPKYVGAPAKERLFVVVNEHENETLRSVLLIADQTSLLDAPSSLKAKYDTASLYQVLLPTRSAIPKD